MNSDENIEVSGRQLVADFQSALLSITTKEVAQYEAHRSEAELLQSLGASSHGNYLNPSNLDSQTESNAARASLDAHIKKVQAEQIKSLSENQIQTTINDDNKAYKGKKVRITLIDKTYQPFETLWFDNQRGYRNFIFKKNSVEGSIEELMFEKNAMLIKPKMLRRLVSNDLKYFIVYVINPDTGEPAVDITLI